MSELVIHNARIITMDDKQPSADAVLVRGDRIAYVGKEKEALNQSDPSAQLIDLAGKTLVPGFNDSHIHTIHLGDILLAPDYSGLNGKQTVESIREGLTLLSSPSLRFKEEST